MIKGEQVIDGTTAEIGTIKDISNKHNFAVVVGTDGHEWTTDIDNLKPLVKSKNTNFEALCRKMVNTHISKNADYGDTFTQSLDEFGNVAFLVRANDKLGRAKNLLMGHKAQVEDEKVTDTLMDLANYCVMMVEYLKNKENETN